MTNKYLLFFLFINKKYFQLKKKCIIFIYLLLQNYAINLNFLLLFFMLFKRKKKKNSKIIYLYYLFLFLVRYYYFLKGKQNYFFMKQPVGENIKDKKTIRILLFLFVFVFIIHFSKTDFFIFQNTK